MKNEKSLSVAGYACLSSAGRSVKAFWEALVQGNILRASDGVHRIQAKAEGSSLDRLSNQLVECWRNIRIQLEPKVNLMTLSNLGVILASTKGCLEDFIWDPTSEDLSRDSLTPILELFLKRAELNPKKSLCISNACASSHAALFLAQQWLLQSQVKHVLVLAVDEVGPFILKGFQSLKALSPTGARPFSEDRDGLALGEATAALLLSSEISGECVLQRVALDTEGYAVTRPSPSGKSLLRACRSALEGVGNIDAIVAHGTATRANDAAEDSTFNVAFEKEKPLVTATKWCVGHTLGVSGAMDTIAACESLRRSVLFPISVTSTVDSTFHSSIYLKAQGTELSGKLNRILVTSLGFGGTHGALVLEKTGAPK